MSFLAWIMLGLMAGFLGSKMVNKTGEGFFWDIILGTVGAVVGGWRFSLFGAQGMTDLNLYSLLVAVVGGRRTDDIARPRAAARLSPVIPIRGPGCVLAVGRNLSRASVT